MAARSFPTFLQALALTLCGAVMFFVGCVGAFTGIEAPPEAVIPRLGIAGMYIGGLALAIGLLLLVFVVIRALARAYILARDGEPPKN